jgi:hypothetical protein
MNLGIRIINYYKVNLLKDISFYKLLTPLIISSNFSLRQKGGMVEWLKALLC